MDPLNLKREWSKSFKGINLTITDMSTKFYLKRMLGVAFLEPSRLKSDS